MNKKLNNYILRNLKSDVSDSGLFSKLKNVFFSMEYIEEEMSEENSELLEMESSNSSEITINIKDFLKQENENKKFKSLLFKLIDERGLKDSDVYNKVHLDRRLFSKI